MSDDDLIRRGGVKDAMTKNGFGGSQMDAAIEAIPAAPLDAMTLERAALVAEAMNNGETAKAIARAIRALAPEPAHVTAARVVKIKPLVWNNDNEARGVGCFYVIWGADGSFKVSENGHVLGGILYGAYRQTYRAISDAKAAAQADYEARIRSAIVEAGE